MIYFFFIFGFNQSSNSLHDSFVSKYWSLNKVYPGTQGNFQKFGSPQKCLLRYHPQKNSNFILSNWQVKFFHLIAFWQCPRTLKLLTAMPSNGDFRNYSLLVGWSHMQYTLFFVVLSVHKLQIAVVSSCTVLLVSRLKTKLPLIH